MIRGDLIFKVHVPTDSFTHYLAIWTVGLHYKIPTLMHLSQARRQFTIFKMVFGIPRLGRDPATYRMRRASLPLRQNVTVSDEVVMTVIIKFWKYRYAITNTTIIGIHDTVRKPTGPLSLLPIRPVFIEVSDQPVLKFEPSYISN